MSAFTQLLHNGSLVRQAERILTNILNDTNTRIWIENPDGTTIELQKGFKIVDFELILTKEE